MTLNEFEVINQLLNKDLKIIQRPDFFNFCIDSLLISDFVSLVRGTKNIVDLGTGNGVIPLFLSQRTDAKIIGVEIQNISAELAKKNIFINSLEKQIEIINDDMKNWKNYFNYGSQDVVITNPPFFKLCGNEEQLNNLDQLSLARHEITIDLDSLISIASKLLKDKGYFAMVHRPDRLLEILDTMKKYNISPKKIQFCHTKLNKPAKILLIEGIRNGKSSLEILPPLICHNDDGKYSQEVLKLFNNFNK
nr:tRNA1(Val) (adenine(37)-N6)-methyltransferase [uncultured Cetobacterium sp.]